MQRLMVEVEIEDGVDAGEAIETLYYRTEVLSVVRMRFVPDKGGGLWERDETTRLPKPMRKG